MSMGLRVCPVCADLVNPSVGRCVRNCEWPPRDTELGRNSAACPGDATSRSTESWVRDSSTDALRITATNLRHILDDIDRELERRDLVGSGEPRAV